MYSTILEQQTNCNYPKALKPLEQVLADLGIQRFTNESVERHKVKVKNVAKVRLRMQIMKEEDGIEKRKRIVDLLKFFFGRVVYSLCILMLFVLAVRWTVAVVMLSIATGAVGHYSVFSTAVSGVILFGIPLIMCLHRKFAYFVIEHSLEETFLAESKIVRLKSRIHWLDWREYSYHSPVIFLRGAPQPPLEKAREMKRQARIVKQYMPDARPFIEALDSEPFFGFQRLGEKYYTVAWGEPEYFPEYVS